MQYTPTPHARFGAHWRKKDIAGKKCHLFNAKPSSLIFTIESISQGNSNLMRVICNTQMTQQILSQFTEMQMRSIFNGSHPKKNLRLFFISLWVNIDRCAQWFYFSLHSRVHSKIIMIKVIVMRCMRLLRISFNCWCGLCSIVRWRRNNHYRLHAEIMRVVNSVRFCASHSRIHWKQWSNLSWCRSYDCLGQLTIVLQRAWLRFNWVIHFKSGCYVAKFQV